MVSSHRVVVALAAVVCLDLCDGFAATSQGKSVTQRLQINGRGDLVMQTPITEEPKATETQYFEMGPDEGVRPDPSALVQTDAGHDQGRSMQESSSTSGTRRIVRDESTSALIPDKISGPSDAASSSAPSPALPRYTNFVGASLLLRPVRMQVLRMSQVLSNAGSRSNVTYDGDDSKPLINETTKNSAAFMILCTFVTVGCLMGLAVSFVNVLAGSPAPRPPEEGGAGMEGNTDGDGGVGGADENNFGLMQEREFVRRPEGLDEDIYGMCICSVVRDSQRFALKTELLGLRLGRMLMSLLVVAFTMTLQVCILWELMTMVTSVSTKEARESYDKYELWMYGNTTGHTTITVNGYHRGVDGYFDIKRFETLDDDVKDGVCQLPISQPTFFICIMLTWTLVCVGEFRHSLCLAYSLLVVTPTIASMGDAVQETPEDGDEAVVVEGLTIFIKTILCIFVFIPRAVVSIVLLWLGSRWLTGTSGFSDVMQNAVTLEFVLLLKDLLYRVMAPGHNKIETRNTLIRPSSRTEKPSTWVFLGAFLWGLAAVVWVLLYMEYFQQVLPEYRWDVNVACTDYLAMTGVSAPKVDPITGAETATVGAVSGTVGATVGAVTGAGGAVTGTGGTGTDATTGAT